MGYLDNRTITVDAILTKKGRELLSSGRQFFNITKFALADDEIDYRLWNTAHPSGSSYYGVAIEQMPVLEPIPDETQCMRYKLVCLDKSTTKIPVVSVTPTSIYFHQGQESIITPSTVYAGGSTTQQLNLNSQMGYTAILHDSDIAYLQVADAAPGAGTAINTVEQEIEQLLQEIAASAGTRDERELRSRLASVLNRQQALAASLGIQGSGTGAYLGDTDTSRSVFAVGLKFRLVAKAITTDRKFKSTVLTVVGNETGGQATVTVRNNAIEVEMR